MHDVQCRQVRKTPGVAEIGRVGYRLRLLIVRENLPRSTERRPLAEINRTVLILVTRLTSNDLDTAGFQTFLSYALLKCVIGLEFDPSKLGHASARGLDPDTSNRSFR